MRFTIPTSLLVSLLFSFDGQPWEKVTAFSVTTKYGRSTSATRHRRHRATDNGNDTDPDADCGCDVATTTTYSGKPRESAKQLNQRQAIRDCAGYLYNSNNDQVRLEDLLVRTNTKVSIVVFLRSLGCPICQEFILQWNKRLEELSNNNNNNGDDNDDNASSSITLIMISIGTTTNLNKLLHHLSLVQPSLPPSPLSSSSSLSSSSLPSWKDILYVDPENKLYDALLLNKGVKETFFSIGTSFSFLKRFTTRGGTKELGEVLSKWNKAIYIPPKQDQAFNQGGTFIFDTSSARNKENNTTEQQTQTIFAHYDESTGAHSDIQQVIDIAQKAVVAATKKK